MRVADSTFFTRMRASLTTRRSELERAQSEATSGLRVQKPSDDPVAAVAARKETAAQKRQEQYLRAGQQAQGLLAVSETALADTHVALLQARDLTLQAATDTVNVEDRLIIAGQIGELMQQVQQLQDTQHAGRYVFSGLRFDTPPFAAGVYQGDTVAASAEVGDGVTLPTGLTGDQVFAPTGGIDVMDVLTDLQTALQTNDTVTIRASIDLLNSGANQISNARASLGTIMQSVDLATGVAEKAHDMAIERRSKLVEIDAIDAFSRLSQAQQALEAAVAVAAQLPPSGLLTQR